jgi:prepilin peptidase CpaA
VAAIAASGLLSAVIDLRTRRVPNWLTYGTAGLGLVLALFGVGGLTVGGAVAGWAVGLLVMLPGYLIAKTGAGDVKLVAGVGTLLGPRLTLMAFVYTAMAGGLLAIIVAIRRRRLRASM